MGGTRRPDDAPIVQLDILPRVDRSTCQPRLGLSSRELLVLRRHGWNFAIGWIDDQRRPPGGCRAHVQPEVVVGAHVASDRRFLSGPLQKTLIAFNGVTFDFSDFFCGQELPSLKPVRTLHGRDGLVRVGPLQIGVAPRGLGHGPTACLLTRGGHRRQHDECENAQRRDKISTLHLTPPRRRSAQSKWARGPGLHLS